MDGVQLSILIATHDRRELLWGLLQSLAAQYRPPDDFEVVVIVDRSLDGTLELLRDRRAALPYDLRFEYQRAPGKPIAINRAVELAAAPYCLVTDDDMTADPRLVEGHMRIQASRAGGVVGIGPMALRMPPDADGLARWFKRDWDARFERLRRGETSLDYRRCYGGNLSFPRQAFLDAGGWIATASQRGGDVELGWRLQQLGLPVVMAPDAWTTQHFPNGFEQLARNAERSGRGAVSTYERHPEMLATELGSYHEASRRSLLLRELLLLVRPSARVLAAADPIIRRLPAANAIYATIMSYFRWRGTREALGADDRWHAVRRGTVILDYGGRPVPADQRAWLRLARHRVIALDRYVADWQAHRIPPARAVIMAPGTLPDGVGFSGEPGVNGPATPLAALRRTRIPDGLSLPRFIMALRTGST